MPIDYKKYPKNWKTELRPAVLERAKNCCEECGVPNYAIGYRDDLGNWNDIEKSFAGDMQAQDAEELGYKIIKIILTVAHLDHDETNENVKIDRLKALCQLHHLRYDSKEKVRRRKQNKHKTNYKLAL